MESFVCQEEGEYGVFAISSSDLLEHVRKAHLKCNKCSFRDCLDCLALKASRASHAKERPPKTKTDFPLQRPVVDLASGFGCESIRKCKMVFIVIDEYSGYPWVFPI